MVKLVVLFRHPTDAAVFDDNYNRFFTLLEQIPTILRRQVADVIGSPMGESPYYRVVEAYFESPHDMREALLSPIGQSAGGQLRTFPAESFDMFFAEVYEEAGGRTLPASKGDGS